MKKIIFGFILICLSAGVVFAVQTFQLQFPVKCQINKNCWILNYVDEDSSPNWHDYKKGRETYDAHTGVDIAIKDVNTMQKGVSVLAAADGFVIATRDGVLDKNALAQDTSKLQNIGCGNRVAIKHISGWVTDYCHMKSGSIKVKKGDFVTAGQPIGQIGLSGLTEFPHLHLNVQRNNVFYDPFTGSQRYQTGKVISTLWTPLTAQKLIYKPHIVYNSGISDEIPTILNIREGKYDKQRISFFSNMIVVWLDMFHVEVGDSVSIVIKNADGNVFFTKKIVIDKANARKMVYAGKRKPQNGFVKGDYSVNVSFRRSNTPLSENNSFKFTVY